MVRRLWSIEGNSQKLDGGAMFGNAPRSLWERWAAPDDRNRIDLACRALLVQEPDRNILFETGIGAFFDPGLKDRYGVQENEHMLLRNLEELELTDADIDLVVLSHLHFDHAGGLLSAWEEGKTPRLLFPKASFLVSARAWERAVRPHPRDRASFIPDLQEQLAGCGRLELADAPSHELLGPDYRLHYSDGHTPGLMLTEIPGAQGPILYASDLIPGRAWVHTSITMGYDRYPELLIDEKRTLLEDLVGRGGRLFFTHDANCASARVMRDEHGRFGTLMPKATLAGQAA